MGCWCSKPGRPEYKAGQSALEAAELLEDGSQKDSYLNLAVQNFEKALQGYEPGHDKVPYMQNAIAESLWKLSRGSPNLSQVERIISFAEQARDEYTPHDDERGEDLRAYFTVCYNLGAYYKRRFTLGTPTSPTLREHGQAAIDSGKLALKYAPTPLDKKKALIQLGNSEATYADIVFRVFGTSEVADCEKHLTSAQKHLEKAEEASKEEKDMYDGLCLQALGNVLLVRERLNPEKSGQDDSSRVIKYYTDASKIDSMPVEERSGLLMNLARAHCDRGYAGDFEEAKNIVEDVLRLINNNAKHPLFAEAYRRLALINWKFYEQSNRTAVGPLRATASHYEKALSHSKESEEAIILFNLANAYAELYSLERTEDNLDIVEKRVKDAKEKCQGKHHKLVDMDRLDELEKEVKDWRGGSRKPTRSGSVMVRTSTAE